MTYHVFCYANIGIFMKLGHPIGHTCLYVISDEREATLLNADSPDFWCQNSLLKLQSLLCSTTLCSSAAPVHEDNSGSPHNIVKSFLDIKPDTVGALSLRYHISRHQSFEM